MGLENRVHMLKYGFNCGSTGEISTERSRRAISEISGVVMVLLGI